MTLSTSGEYAATSTGATILETSRVVIVAGVVYGVVVAGVGSRLAMLLLRVSSPQRVIGMRSDDDFVIGRFTLAGTYGLLVIGAAVGIVGAGMYLLVAPRLLGPTWFRQVTVGVACAAVVGSMLIHAGGVDFTQLKPKWLSIGLFIALPGVFGTFIGPTVNAVRSTQSWTVRGRRRWLIPIVLLGCFLPALPVALVAVVVVGAATIGGMNETIGGVRSTRAFGIVIRAAWLTIAVGAGAGAHE